ncbi:MAG: sigma-70 family RNA polymerase sigma factor [Candidatus Binatia bacterium]
MSGADNPGHLIRQMAEGDRGAFGSFYDQYCSLVFSFALRLLKDRPSAEDLLQEAFMQIWRQAKNYDEERGSPEAWLINITRSRAIDSLRSKRRRDRSFVSTEDPGGAIGREVGSMSDSEPELKLTVQGALASLPEAQRRVLELAYLDGLTQSEIAARLKEPLGTVKTRVRAGLQKLRETIGK